jgi:hypothetical protein
VVVFVTPYLHLLVFTYLVELFVEGGMGDAAAAPVTERSGVGGVLKKSVKILLFVLTLSVLGTCDPIFCC